MARTPIELEENIVGVLCYVLGWASGIYFIQKEKENKFIRFHAMQSIVAWGGITIVFLIMFIISRVFKFIPFLNIIFFILYWLLGLAAVILWMVLMAKAYQGERYKLPWAGNFAEKQLNRLNRKV
jgi:uncharacterized membrane protein